MREGSNTLLKILVPVVFLLAALGVGLAVLVNTGKPRGATTTPPAGPSAAATPVPAVTPAPTGPASGDGAATQPSTAAAPATAPDASASTQGAIGVAGATGVSAAPAAAAATPAPTPAPVGLAARVIPAREAGWPWAPLGSLDAPGSGAAAGGVAGAAGPRMMIEFSPAGAGVSRLRLREHFRTVRGAAVADNHEVLQEAASVVVPMTDGSTRVRSLVPFALVGVFIDGAFVNLAAAPGADAAAQAGAGAGAGAGGDAGGGAAPMLWRQVAPGRFEAEIIDAAGGAVATVTRSYSFAGGAGNAAGGGAGGPGGVGTDSGYDLVLEQTLVNRTARPVKVRWVHLGPIDLPFAGIRYGGDVRRVRMGWLSGPTADPLQQVVLGDDEHMLGHGTALGSPAWDGFAWRYPEKVLWPTAATREDALSLAWAGLTSRYFAVLVHALPERQPARTDVGTPAPDKRLRAVAQLDRVVLEPASLDKSVVTQGSVMALRMTSDEATVAPGGIEQQAVGVYAGPKSRRYADAEPGLRAMGLGEVVIYTFGGPCAFCTFQPVAYLLRWYLGVLHDWVLFDWALAIIVLVLTVRTLLHPVTKWSQMNLARFGKQMAALAPKQAKLKEKFGHDPARFRAELQKLMQEEKVNYAGALGCLPMFLQMPVWVALYAMIFFTFELRHEGAFFGLFQLVGHPTFLADLAEPDTLVPLGVSLRIPWISDLMGPIEGVNLLPILMGVVFWIQQKYLTPPTAATMSPEQQQMQTTMKVMTVVMFPLFMYNAPAALSLYFMTNSTVAIIESRLIRKKIDREDAAREAARLAAGPGQRTGGDHDDDEGRQGRPAGRPTGPRPGPGPGGRRGEPAPKPGFMERIRLAVEAKQKELDAQRKAMEKAKQKGRK